jgi:hypothetical protein
MKRSKEMISKTGNKKQVEKIKRYIGQENGKWKIKIKKLE